NNNNNNNNNNNPPEEIVIMIKDSGKGVDPQSLHKLFSKFFSTSGTGGTGLGLYISKAIVEAHGGKLWVENNKEEKGATFSFSLPLGNQQSHIHHRTKNVTLPNN
ncbi:MAG: ATP-binding protein, partial [Thermoproteota archaeon]|nr:ATP-binding protein [Thermoproteota archaeon]